MIHAADLGLFNRLGSIGLSGSTVDALTNCTIVSTAKDKVGNGVVDVDVRVMTSYVVPF
jgi:hypothetical protein